MKLVATDALPESIVKTWFNALCKESGIVRFPLAASMYNQDALPDQLVIIEGRAIACEIKGGLFTKTKGVVDKALRPDQRLTRAKWLKGGGEWWTIGPNTIVVFANKYATASATERLHTKLRRRVERDNPYKNT